VPWCSKGLNTVKLKGYRLDYNLVFQTVRQPIKAMFSIIVEVFLKKNYFKAFKFLQCTIFEFSKAFPPIYVPINTNRLLLQLGYPLF